MTAIPAAWHRTVMTACTLLLDEQPGNDCVNHVTLRLTRTVLVASHQGKPECIILYAVCAV